MKMEKEKPLAKGLYPRTWIIILLAITIQVITTQVQATMTNYWLFPSGLLPLAPTLLIFFFHNILPEKLRLRKQELALLIGVSFFNANAFYLLGGYISPYGGAQLLPGIGPAAAAFMKYASPYKESFGAFIPDWMAPSQNLNAIFEGVPIDWGAWTPSILFYFAVWMAFALFGLFLALSLRKPFIKTERLIFPIAAATYPLLDLQMEKEPGHKRVKILDFSTAYAKAFWIGGAVGLIIGASDVLNYFIPAIPPSSEFAGNHIDLTGLFQQYLPGAFGNTWLWWVDIPIYVLCPLDVTLTCIIFNIGILMIYPAIAVRLGWVSYVPGVEQGTAQYGNVEGPFKFNYWGTYGLMFGIGVWVAWNYREHFLNILRNAFGSATGPKEEDGVPYRFVGIGLIATWILMLIIWMAVGVPVAVSLTAVVLFVLFELANTKTRADAYIEHVQLPDARGWLYDVGYGTGSWGQAPVLDGALFKSMYFSSASVINSTWTGHHSSYQIMIFKITDEANTDPKDVIKTMIVTSIFTFFVATLFGMWWWTRIGGINTNPGYDMWTEQASGAQTYTLNPGHTLTAMERVTYAISGIIVVFGCFFLRARFPWFFIHPVGIWTALLSCCHLWPPVMGFIYKYTIMKIGGTRLWERVGIPGIIGFTVIQNLGMFFILAWIGFWTQALPAAMTYV